jgi:hypothetical protein
MLLYLKDNWYVNQLKNVRIFWTWKS